MRWGNVARYRLYNIGRTNAIIDHNATITSTGPYIVISFIETLMLLENPFDQITLLLQVIDLSFLTSYLISASRTLLIHFFLALSSHIWLT